MGALIQTIVAAAGLKRDAFDWGVVTRSAALT